MFAATGSKRLPQDLKNAGLFDISTSMQNGKWKQPFAESSNRKQSLPKVQMKFFGLFVRNEDKG
jgi:hypothetical protein